MKAFVGVPSESHLLRNISLKRLLRHNDETQFKTCKVKLFEQLFIFGAPPHLTQNPTPTLLVTFPSTKTSSHVNTNLSNILIEQLKDLCFPAGFQPYFQHTFSSKPDRSNIISDVFAFYISNSANELHFGICVQFHATDANSPFFSTPFSRKYPFSLCFISKTPHLSSHFQFAACLALLLCRIEKPVWHFESNRTIALLPIHGFCHDSLQLDKNYPAVAVLKGFQVPRCFYEQVSLLYSIETKPIPKQRIIPAISLSDCIFLNLPFHLTNVQCLAYPTLQFLFSYLSPSIIVLIYNSILLEQRVLFVSKNLQLVSFSIIASTLLIHPFITQASVMPIVPEKECFRELLESPAPYIAGSPQPHPNADLIINLDENSFLFQNTTDQSSSNSVNSYQSDATNLVFPNGMPKLPKFATLVQKLEMYLKDNEKVILAPPKETKSFFGISTHNPQYDNFFKNANIYTFPSTFGEFTHLKYVFTPFIVDEILNIFGTFLIPQLTMRLQECFVTDTTDENMVVTVANRDLLLWLVPKTEKNFYSTFMGTQIFDDFCDKITNDYSVSVMAHRHSHIHAKNALHLSRSMPIMNISSDT